MAIEGYNCEEVMDNISFWENLLDVIEKIENMSEKEREKRLFDIVQREMLEGRTWRRQVLKICLTDSRARRKAREEIITGRIYS